MRNKESLLEFLYDQAKKARSNELHMSAYMISKSWKIKKNKRKIEYIPMEVGTSRVYIINLLRQLEKEGKLSYETKQIRHPLIKLYEAKATIKLNNDLGREEEATQTKPEEVF